MRQDRVGDIWEKPWDLFVTRIVITDVNPNKDGELMQYATAPDLDRVTPGYRNHIRASELELSGYRKVAVGVA